MKSLVMLLLVFSLPGLVAAQQANGNQADPFLGTWKLDVGKSHFDPGPPPASETLTMTADRVRVHDTINLEGEEHSADWSYPVRADGEPAPITGRGMQNCTVMSKRVDDHTIEYTWNFSGQILRGRAVVSKDGKTMHSTMTGTGPNGQTVKDVATFKKESANIHK